MGFEAPHKSKHLIPFFLRWGCRLCLGAPKEISELIQNEGLDLLDRLWKKWTVLMNPALVKKNY